MWAGLENGAMTFIPGVIPESVMLYGKGEIVQVGLMESREL